MATFDFELKHAKSVLLTMRDGRIIYKFNGDSAWVSKFLVAHTSDINIPVSEYDETIRDALLFVRNYNETGVLLYIDYSTQDVWFTAGYSDTYEAINKTRAIQFIGQDVSDIYLHFKSVYSGDQIFLTWPKQSPTSQKRSGVAIVNKTVYTKIRIIEPFFTMSQEEWNNEL